MGFQLLQPLLSARGEDFTSVVALSNVVVQSKRLQTMLLVTRSMLLVRGMPLAWRDAKNREQIGKQEQMLNEPAICLRRAPRWSRIKNTRLTVVSIFDSLKIRTIRGKNSQIG